MVGTSTIYPTLGARVDDALFFTRSAKVDGGGDLSVVDRVELDGGMATTVATFPPGIVWVAADSVGTYVVDYDGRVTAIGSDGGILYAVGQAGTPAAAKSGRFVYVDPNSTIRVLAPDGGLPTFGLHMDGVFRLAADDQSVYWMTAANDAGLADLGRVELVGGAVSLLQAEPAPTAIAVDDAYVYFYAGAAKEFRRVAKDLKTPTELVAKWTGLGGDVARSMLADGSYVYAVLEYSYSNFVVRVPKCGGVPLVLAPHAPAWVNPGSQLAVDEAYVYFATVGGDLARVPK